MVDAIADRLETEIPGAWRGWASHLAGYEALYVHFHDAKLPQELAVWLFAVKAGTANNVPRLPDAIGVGLKHDADNELDRASWRLRPLTPLSWRTHVDDRYEGFRWLRDAGDLPHGVDAVADEIASRVLVVLRRAGALRD